VQLYLGMAIGLAAGFLLFHVIERLRAGNLRREAERLLEAARREAERTLKDAEIAAKEESFRKREEVEREAGSVRNELKDWERRLAKKEDGIDEKADIVAKKEKQVEALERALSAKSKKVEERDLELQAAVARQIEELQSISGMSRDEASRLLLSRLEKELEHEQAQLIQRFNERSRAEADRNAREIVVTAIQRVAANHCAEVTVSSLDLPNDEMKGRIIGREGRNIRAFEKATGVDVIVDDTPGIIVLSGFDPVRREMARRAMEKLIADGRIHPARIEEVVEACKREMNEFIQEKGRAAALEIDLPDLHPKLVTLLGRLHFRTSYGQNVLRHSIEVANLCAMMASELGLDAKLAKRCGLLHDIGKAVDHELEGGHPEIGADLAKKFGEPHEVVNAIAAHHEAVPQETLYAVLAQACDAVSGARPGARGESLERYIKRMEKLEAVATQFPGVRQAYAIQAGREVRVVVNSGKVNDKQAAKLARDIAKEIENQLTYPGEVKVTLLRETRVIEYAR